MKFKVGFSLVLLLIVLFSISSVCASENLTYDASNPVLAGNDELDADVCESSDGPILNLSVESNVSEASYQDNIELNVTLKSVGGDSHNVNVSFLSNSLSYISHFSSRGSFNQDTLIWNIGDLADGETAYLIINAMLISDDIISLRAVAESDFSKSFRVLRIEPVTNDFYDDSEYDDSYSGQSNNNTHHVTKSNDTKIKHPIHYNPNKYSEFRSLKKSGDKREFEAETTKNDFYESGGDMEVKNNGNNSKNKNSKDTKSETADGVVNNSNGSADIKNEKTRISSEYSNYLPWIIVLVVVMAAAGIVFKKYYK